ncbi:MAG: hypothetical protein GX273_01645, partial [Bacteroidales bacterium]|nr:hypothetical protein [Bacteroidales bacterium]
QGTRVVCHQAIFVKRTKAPYYNTAYKYKAELNWYFDIIEKNPELTYLHNKIPVVYYYLGGAGYKNFWRNLFEWVFLVYKRFGIKTFIKSKVYLKAWEKIKYRYPKIFIKEAK